jgi:hypothetical protein
MSQSDYLQRKKLATNLKTPNQTKFPNSINSNDYTLYKQFTLENTIPNTSKLYNQLVLPGKAIIFDMELANTATCPQFVICKNTQTRPYRKLVNPAAMNPYASIGQLPYITGPNNTVKNQLKFVKQPPIHKCPPCYYDSSYNKTHTNNQNTDRTACANNRLNQTNCALMENL